MESDLLGHRQASIACGWSNGKTLAFQASDRGSIPRLHIFIHCEFLKPLRNGVYAITEQGEQHLDCEVDADELSDTADGDSKASAATGGFTREGRFPRFCTRIWSAVVGKLFGSAHTHSNLVDPLSRVSCSVYTDSL